MRRRNNPVLPNEFVYVIVFTDMAGRKRYADGMAHWDDRQAKAYRFRDGVSTIHPWGLGWARAHANYMRQITSGGVAEGGRVQVRRLIPHHLSHGMHDPHCRCRSCE